MVHANDSPEDHINNSNPIQNLRRTIGSHYDPKIQKGDSSKTFTNDSSIAVD